MSSFDPATVRKAVDEFTPRRPEKFQDLLPAKDVITELRPDYLKNLWLRDVPEMEKETHALLAENGYVLHETGGWIKSDFVKRNK